MGYLHTPLAYKYTASVTYHDGTRLYGINLPVDVGACVCSLIVAESHTRSPNRPNVAKALSSHARPLHNNHSVIYFVSHSCLVVYGHSPHRHLFIICK